jgi:hypothetical protein
MSRLSLFAGSSSDSVKTARSFSLNFFADFYMSFCMSEFFFSVPQIMQHRLQMSENRVQGKIFGPKRETVGGGWRILLMTSFIICTLRQVFSSVMKSRSLSWEVCLRV